MKKILIILFILLTTTIIAQTPSGDMILEKVDENFGSDNKIIVGKMIIHGRRGTRTIVSKSWVQGTNRAFSEFLAPAREKGTKMLKLEDQLWTYSPGTDRTIKISGHMLRQSIMGSDFSYEDRMEDPILLNIYSAKVIDEEIFLDRPCWVLELTAKKPDIAYYTRKIWVDKERYILLKENRYAKSGKMLKTAEVKEVIRIQNRWVANKAVYKDVFDAECLGYKQWLKYEKEPPPFENFLGPDCLKYCEKRPLKFDMDKFEFKDGLNCYYDRDKNICSWRFFSCDECIFIGDINRNEKFTEYDPRGITVWRSQLP